VAAHVSGQPGGSTSLCARRWRQQQQQQQLLLLLLLLLAMTQCRPGRDRWVFCHWVQSLAKVSVQHRFSEDQWQWVVLRC
jgi:hypothetical protein